MQDLKERLVFTICARNLHFQCRKEKKTSTLIHLHLFSRNFQKFSRTESKFKGFQVLENKKLNSRTFKDFQGAQEPCNI